MLSFVNAKLLNMSFVTSLVMTSVYGIPLVQHGKRQATGAACLTNHLDSSGPLRVANSCGPNFAEGGLYVGMPDSLFGFNTFDRMTGDNTNPYCGRSVTLTNLNTGLSATAIITGNTTPNLAQACYDPADTAKAYNLGPNSWDADDALFAALGGDGGDLAVVQYEVSAA